MCEIQGLLAGMVHRAYSRILDKDTIKIMDVLRYHAPGFDFYDKDNKLIAKEAVARPGYGPGAMLLYQPKIAFRP